MARGFGRFGPFLLVLGSSIVALIAAEGVLRIVGDHRYLVWPPDLNRTLEPIEGLMPGIQGPARVITSSDGIRGAPFSDSDRVRVLAVGGSTTECYYLDQAETWPYLLAERLRLTLGDEVWVGNVGRSGHSSRHHTLQTRHLLDQYPRIDVVLVLAGLNDFMQRLRRDSTYRALTDEPAEYSQELMRRAFAESPQRNAAEPAHKRTALWQLARRTRQGLSAPQQRGFQDDGGIYVAEARRRRATARRLIDTLPDLSAALADYERNLRTIATNVSERGMELVLITQPTIWQANLPERLGSLLWFGQRGDSREYYSIAALARGMAAYNERLKRVCEDSDAICVDLAAQLPRDTTVFYDDTHFNESGARMVARELDIVFAGDPRLSRFRSRGPDR